VVEFVPHAALKAAADESATLVQAFWRETLMQAAISQEWIINLGRRDAFARIAHIVCELTVRLQASGLARLIVGHALDPDGRCRRLRHFERPCRSRHSGIEASWTGGSGFATAQDP
jgi:hypothetical protein